MYFSLFYFPLFFLTGFPLLIHCPFFSIFNINLFARYNLICACWQNRLSFVLFVTTQAFLCFFCQTLERTRCQISQGVFLRTLEVSLKGGLTWNNFEAKPRIYSVGLTFWITRTPCRASLWFDKSSKTIDIAPVFSEPKWSPTPCNYYFEEIRWNTWKLRCLKSSFNYVSVQILQLLFQLHEVLYNRIPSLFFVSNSFHIYGTWTHRVGMLTEKWLLCLKKMS